MKQLIAAGILLVALRGYAQTAIKTQPYSKESLNSYLWSFSKNSVKPGGKALVDFDVMDKQRGFGFHLSVSNDGNYFAYTINKMVYNDFRFGLYRLDSLVIQSTKTGQRTVLSGIQPGSFTADSKQYIFQDGNALCFLQLNGMQTRKIGDVASFKTAQNKWLAYQLKDKNDLVLHNLVKGKEKQFPGVSDFEFDGSGSWLVGKNNAGAILLYGLATGIEKQFSGVVDYTFSADGKSLVLKTNTNLQYINLSQGDAKNIWTIQEKTGIGNYSLDASGKQVVFTIVDSADAASKTVGYYEEGMDKAVVKANNTTSGSSSGFGISDASFTDNGRYIKLTLQSKPAAIEKPGDDIAGVEVWNHKDLDLQSAQSGQLNRKTNLNAIVSINDGKLVLPESSDKKIFTTHGDFALLKKDYGSIYGDRFWEKREDSCWLVSLKDGSGHLLPAKAKRFWFSPSGNYLVYFDGDKSCHYFSYDLHSGSVHDIAANVPDGQLAITDRSEGNNQKTNYGNLAAWIENDEGVLVYDNYDIWRLDLAGKEPAVNLTGGFGKANHIVLNMFSTDHYSPDIPTVAPGETLRLRGFNDRNKELGFYSKAVARVGDPQLIYKGGFFMTEIAGCYDGNVLNSVISQIPPVKAKNVNSWIVQKQSPNEAPNFYETSDFKNYKRLTNYQPEKGYQWLTEELVSFKYLDGNMGQGILYKPENFDPTKKYPVLIAFYGAFSNNRFQFPMPSYIDQAMETGKSPLWFLNNGFLVFTPDIAVAPGKYGPKAFSVIEGAAQYLKQLPYVDGNKLGAASHSWGAKLAAYNFTHSTSIAATAITEGWIYGNIINVALSTAENGKSELEDVEFGGYEYGSLWNRKDSWLDQTTVLNVDKAVSPLLLLCNHESSPEYQNQTLQFFTALRRLDKNVWWLKYDKGSHTLSDHNELRDYTVRYTQFFDHYLKNAPAPMWMTQGIPLKLKGIESRYELDPKGRCNAPNGEACPICEAWNKQYKRMPEMFEKDNKDWALDNDIAEALRQAQDDRRKQLDKEGEVRTRDVMKMLNR